MSKEPVESSTKFWQSGSRTSEEHTEVIMLISHHSVVLLNSDNITVLGTVHSVKFLGLVTYLPFDVQLFTLAAKLTCELSGK